MSSNCLLYWTDDQKSELEVAAIHNEDGYQTIRKMMSDQYNLGDNEPNIQVYNVNIRGNRGLTLRHYQHNRKPLEEVSAQEILKHVYRLWGFPVRLESCGPDGGILKTFHCPPDDEKE